MGKRMDDDYKILQMIPALGWYAHFQQQDDKYQLPVICWALIDDDDSGFSMIKGMLPLEGSAVLWTPDEIEECFSDPHPQNENRLRFSQYTQASANLPGISVND